jgi:hypothetical protein
LRRLGGCGRDIDELKARSQASHEPETARKGQAAYFRGRNGGAPSYRAWELIEEGAHVLTRAQVMDGMADGMAVALFLSPRYRVAVEAGDVTDAATLEHWLG